MHVVRTSNEFPNRLRYRTITALLFITLCTITRSTCYYSLSAPTASGAICCDDRDDSLRECEHVKMPQNDDVTECKKNNATLGLAVIVNILQYAPLQTEFNVTKTISLAFSMKNLFAN